MNAVLTVDCHEPEGVIARMVSPMPLTRENLLRFYEEASRHRVLFVDDVNGDFHKFCELFLSFENGTVRSHGLFWVVDDFVGIFYLTHMTETEALAHFAFFDGRFRGREILVKSMMQYVFERYGFQRLNTEVGLYAGKYVMKFVQSLGFVWEGRKRQAVRYKDSWFDLGCYGILRNEALDGNQNS